MTESVTGFDDQPDESDFIAVIGMAGRFPGAADLDEFWENLVEGRDTIERGLPQVFRGDAEDGSDLTYVPARGRLERPEWFDAEYFGLTARDAVLTDPQHRVFLECALEALEDAGQDPDRFPGTIGVYGGSTETAYARYVDAHREALGGLTDDEILLATAPDFLPLRTAERLGLGGPAVAVQTACATALVAVHTAGRALLAGDCDMALAGGVAVHVPPKAITWTGPDGTLAPDGVCRAFDAHGAGTVASNGAGVVVLKRLVDARIDGDCVRAVVRGSAVTNDGAARIGFTAPSVPGQAAAVRDAQLAAGTDAGTITYVEAHGTATPLGDPIEIAALTEAFRQDTDARGFCAIGSVKTNIGHADAAAGAAGLIKTVLALEHGTIPPSLHHTEPNPRIDFEASPFRVATRPLPWKPRGGARRAGVSAFAVGGVNAHLVLEEAPAEHPADSDRPAQLFVHSARTATALHAQLRRLDGHLERHPDASPADVAWTLQTGRRQLPHRAVRVTGPHGTDWVAAAEPVGPDRPVALLFPGTAPPSATRRLHTTEPAFREAFRACTDALDPELARAVRQVARGLDRLDAPEVRDAYVFAVEYALAALWRRWGVSPDRCWGIGVGALTAAAVTGSLSLTDALRRTAERNRTPSGSADASAEPDDTDAALAALLADSGLILLEVGAGTTLTERAARHPGRSDRHLFLATLPQAEHDDTDVLPGLYTALGRLWAAGTAVDWAGVHDGERRRKVSLPTYPFERLPYLLRDPAEAATSAVPAGAAADAAPAVAEESAPEQRPDPVPRTAGTPGEDTPLGLVLHLFQEALGLPDIAPDESFFELGGDSLIATKLLARIRDTYPVDIKMRSLFTAATAADLAALIEQQLAEPGHGSATDEEPS
ncbi:beta-ketoacyl synthase N-terminal-like domain-containing protein [Streptomyces sp. NPDC051576]|uniref:type I polyketide synthase n=1 Tax=Streptomyces sp. NPDC051576 TaxID=3155803 RepID=UPI0034427E3E